VSVVPRTGRFDEAIGTVLEYFLFWDIWYQVVYQYNYLV